MKIRKHGRTYEHPPPLEKPGAHAAAGGDAYTPGFFDRTDPGARPAETAREPDIYKTGRRFTWKFWLKWGSVALLIAIVVVGVFGYFWLRGKESHMRIAGLEGVLEPGVSGQAVNTLVVGVDRGSVQGEGGQGRSDIMMLVCVSGDGKQSAVVSIPRDTLVSIPGQGNREKVNAAHALGGPALTVRTVESFTGLEINHYVELDFVAFRDIVNALGGVQMHIDKEIKDPYAGDVPAGDVKLDGGQALSLVRARHDVDSVPAGDLDRVKNQREFFKALLAEVSRERNPFTMIKVVNAVSNGVKTDLTFWQMFNLGRKLKGKGDALVTKSIPGEATVLSDGGWYYVAEKSGMSALLAPFKPGAASTETGKDTGENSPGVVKSDISVKVLNGSGTTGLASSVSKELQRKGYAVSASANAKSAYDTTAVYYAGGDSAGAEAVAADLAGAGNPTLKRSDGLTGEYGVDVLVVLGSDYGKS